MAAKRNQPVKNILFWAGAGVIIILLWSLLQTPGMVKTEVTFSQFLTTSKAQRVEKVTVEGSQVNGQLKDGSAFKTVLPAQFNDLVKILRDNKVDIVVKDANRSTWLSILFTWSPLLLIVLFWFFFMRQMQAGGNKAMSFGKSRAKLFSAMQKKATFKDVAGVEEAKDELQEIVGFLKEPQEIPETRRPDPEGSSSGRRPRHGENPIGPGDRRRSRCALFLDQRLRLRRNVRRRRRVTRPGLI